MGETLDYGLRVYRTALVPLLGLSALFAAPYAIAMQYFGKAWSGDQLMAPLLRAGGYAVPPTPEALLGRSLLAAFGGLLLTAIIYMAMVRVADQVWRGEMPTLGRALLWSLARLFRAGTTLVLVVAGAGAMMLAGSFVAAVVLGIVISVAGLTEADFLGGVVLYVMGFGGLAVMALVAQTAWLSFLYVPQVIAVEGRGWFGAIGRSMGLVWGRFFRTTGLFWATVALWGALSLISWLPSFLWETAVGQSGLALVGGMVQGAIGLLVFPLVPLVTTVGYYDLRLRAEGHDMAAQIARLEEEGRHG